ncbi:carbohydrate-binding family 9-like protein [bacterium]|nr:carbohydrate-binding family 9-like protein [bacterium]
MTTRLALIACLLIPACLWAAPPTYPCHRPATAPVVDGDVAGDPAWQTIPSVTGFSVLGNGYTYAKQTAAQLCWTDAGLFIAVVCEEPDAKLLKPQAFDGGDTWAEDSIEIFIQPKRNADTYQFAITAGGAKGGFEGHPDITKMKAAAKIGDSSYSLETLIPWAIVNATAKAGDKWTADICRNIFTTKSGGDKFTCWAPLQSRFFEPENFATLVFEGGTLTSAQTTALTEKLNQEYRGTLLKQVAQAVKSFGEYREGLVAAAQDAKYGAQAQALLADWQRFEAINREADKAGILEMREALMKLEVLNRQSYEVKYGFLIYKLLKEN